MTLNMVRINYFAIMVTFMHFPNSFLWISSRRTKKSIYKRKKEHKSANDPFIAVLLHFYDLKYINSLKNRFFNQKMGMVLKVTLILNLKIIIVFKFQVFIFKNDEVRGGGGAKYAPLTLNKLAR